jgi:hypothetical protein
VAINIHEQMDSQKASLMNKTWANRDMPLFRGWPLHHMDTSRTSNKQGRSHYLLSLCKKWVEGNFLSKKV